MKPDYISIPDWELLTKKYLDTNKLLELLTTRRGAVDISVIKSHFVTSGTIFCSPIFFPRAKIFVTLEVITKNVILAI